MSVLAGRDLTVELRSLNGKRQLEELAAPARDTKRQVVIAIEVAAGENLKEKQVNGRLARVRGGIRSLRGRQSETRSSSDAPASPTARKGESPKQVKGEKSAAEENGETEEFYSAQEQQENEVPKSFQELSKAEFMKQFEELVRGRRMQQPLFCGINVDPYVVYKAVIARGGHEHVSKSKEWAQICRLLNPPKMHSSASFAMKTLYFRYVHPLVIGDIPKSEPSTSRAIAKESKPTRTRRARNTAEKPIEYPDSFMKLDRMSRTQIKLPTWLKREETAPPTNENGDATDSGGVEGEGSQERLFQEDKFLVSAIQWLRRCAATGGMAKQSYSAETTFNYKLISLRTRAALNCGKLPLRYRKGPSRYIGSLGSSRRTSWWKATMPRVGHTFQVNALPSPVLASLFKDGKPVEDGMDTEDLKVDDRKRLVDLECANMKALSGERIYDDKAPQMKCTPPVVQTDVYSGEDWNQNYEERKAQTARVVEEFNQSMRDSSSVRNCKWAGCEIERHLDIEDERKFQEGLERYGRDFRRIRKFLLPDHNNAVLVSYYYNFWKPRNMKWRLKAEEAPDMEEME